MRTYYTEEEHMNVGNLRKLTEILYPNITGEDIVINVSPCGKIIAYALDPSKSSIHLFNTLRDKLKYIVGTAKEVRILGNQSSMRTMNTIAAIITEYDSTHSKQGGNIQ